MNDSVRFAIIFFLILHVGILKSQPYYFVGKYDYGKRDSTFIELGISKISKNKLLIKGRYEMLKYRIISIDENTFLFIRKNQQFIGEFVTNDTQFKSAYWYFHELVPTEYVYPGLFQKESYAQYIKSDQGFIEPMSADRGVIHGNLDSITEYSGYYELKRQFEFDEIEHIHLKIQSMVYPWFLDTSGRFYTFKGDDFELNIIDNLSLVGKMELKNKLVGDWNIKEIQTSVESIKNDPDYKFRIDSAIQIYDLSVRPENILHFKSGGTLKFEGAIELSPSGKYLVLKNKFDSMAINFDLKNDELVLKILKHPSRLIFRFEKEY